MKYREELKDGRKEAHLFSVRANIALILVVLGFLIIGWHIFDLQIRQHPNFVTLSDRNRIAIRPIPPVRGLIYDRNGVILADNQVTYSLEITPEQVPNLDDTLTQLQSLLAFDDEHIENFREALVTSRRFEKVTLLARLTEAQRARFEVNRHRFPGVSVEGHLTRHYPYGALFVHVIGYVGRITQDDMQSLNIENYRGTRHIGRTGLEKYYESVLHGKVGHQEVEITARGRIVRTLNTHPSQPGSDLHLAIDYRLQRLATQLLQNHRGALVALDPRTGEVLALVSMPAYDPNAFVTGISTRAFQQLIQSADRPLFNRAIRGKYPPGSTIKPMLGLAGLEYGVISPTYTINDLGWFQLPGEERRFRDWNWKQGGHGRVDLSKAIRVSCDTFFYDLAVKLGIDRIHESMAWFGFDAPTGLDVYEESQGLLPSREWKRRTRHLPWFPGETVNVGIGQGFWTTTPIQLANATAVLANRGTHFQTRFVHAISHQGKRNVLPPVLSEKQVTAHPENMAVILRAMRDVNTKGTGARAFANAPFSSAGKTGTAQLISIGQDEEYEAENIDARLRDNAMYVGFAPFESPTIAVAVVVENQGHGGKVAAPIAREVMAAWLSMQGDNEGHK